VKATFEDPIPYAAYKYIEELEAENERLREQSDDQLRAEKELADEVERLRAALEDLVRDAQAAVDQDNPFLGQQLNQLAWHSIPAARQALGEK
jgi:phage shock protein A